VRWPSRREKALFRTHQPLFNSPEWAVGKVVQHDGRLYRVTRWEELPPVHLERGGSVGEWEIWGKMLSDEEMRQEVLDAAERIKGGDSRE
jgi:hypothetical protein